MPRYIDADALIHEYYKNPTYLNLCTAINNAPTADVVEIKKDGEWEMFDLISSAYYGKRMYFKEDNGIVYSRYSCKYMSVDEAIREFVSLIDDSDLPTAQPEQRWIPVSERLPEVYTRCLCTYENKEGTCIDFGLYMKRGWFVSGVTAWMPLPDPYKEEKNDARDKDKTT